MKKITILIADDHKLVRESWVALFNSDPRFEVIADCGNGQETVDLAKKLHPQVVILDINMPGLDGFETTTQVRNYLPGCKILCISMHCLPVYVRKIMKAGANGYITKNSPAEEAIMAITEICQNRPYICNEVKNILADSCFNEDGKENLISSLSKRELNMISYLKQGLSSKMIALTTNLSPRTIEVHRYNILKKLKLPNVAALINFVNQNGLKISL